MPDLGALGALCAEVARAKEPPTSLAPRHSERPQEDSSVRRGRARSARRRSPVALPGGRRRSRRAMSRGAGRSYPRPQARARFPPARRRHRPSPRRSSWRLLRQSHRIRNRRPGTRSPRRPGRADRVHRGRAGRARPGRRPRPRVGRHSATASLASPAIRRTSGATRSRPPAPSPSMCGIQAPRPNPSRPSRQARTRRHNRPRPTGAAWYPCRAHRRFGAGLPPGRLHAHAHRLLS
jgi:hypothetical protein